MNICFHHHFHGVRQGLFASGCLYQANDPQPKFLWVYDCGSTSTSLLGPRIHDLKRFVNGRYIIDLLAISHFDKDHISGVAKLLGEFQVRTLLLPYVPLWERLLIAFERGITDEADLEPFIDPVRYLTSVEGAEIERVVIVPPGNDDDIPPGERGTIEGDNLPEGPWKQFYGAEDLKYNEDKAAQYADAELGATIEILDATSSVSVLGLWEFVPYNANRTTPISSSFETAVIERRIELLDDRNSSSRGELLQGLKEIYDEEFGKSSQARNVISLFLYSGPIYETWDDYQLRRSYPQYLPPFPKRCPCFRRVHPRRNRMWKKCSVLYSGDGYLDQPNLVDDLRRRMGEERMKKLGIFQVNHHGAEANWHKGLAKSINPDHSVFSSNPDKHPHHPHESVLRDFWTYRPVQVNANGHSYCGWLLKEE